MSTVEERVKKIVCEQLGVKESEVQNSSSFVEDLGADSLDTVELVMALEEEFETASTVTLRLLEPAIIVAMGGAVAVIVLSIMLPILRLNALAAG